MTTGEILAAFEALAAEEEAPFAYPHQARAGPRPRSRAQALQARGLIKGRMRTGLSRQKTSEGTPLEDVSRKYRIHTKPVRRRPYRAR